MSEQVAETSLAGRASAGAMWLTLQTWVSRLGGFVTVAILARLLTPSDFGVLAVAMSILPIVYLIADLGFTTYIVQAPTLDRRTTNTSFWASTSVGLLLTAGLIVAAPALAKVFGVEESASVIAALAPAILIVSLGATPIALLRRDMRFRALSIQGATGAILGQLCALVLAFAGFGVWALVVQVLVAQLTGLVLAWRSARWWPHLTIGLSLLPHMLGFGVKVMGVDFAAMGRLWIENVVISRLLGVASLGQYGMAQRLVQTVRDVSGSAIAPVSTVAFAKVRDDPIRLFSGYRRAVGLSFAVTAPALSCLLVLAPVAVPLVFGPQWYASIGPTIALCVAGIVALAAVLDHGLFYGLGRPGTWLAYAIVVEVVSLLVTLAVVRFGIDAVAWGLAAVTLTATFGRWFLVARLLKVRARSIAWITAVPTGLVALSVAVGEGMYWLLGTLSHDSLNPFLTIAIVGIVVVAVHFFGFRIAMPGTIEEARTLLAGTLRRIPRLRKVA